CSKYVEFLDQFYELGNFIRTGPHQDRSEISADSLLCDTTRTYHPGALLALHRPLLIQIGRHVGPQTVLLAGNLAGENPSRSGVIGKMRLPRAIEFLAPALSQLPSFLLGQHAGHIQYRALMVVAWIPEFFDGASGPPRRDNR